MRKHRYILNITAASALAIGLGGCSAENAWDNVGDETGTISLTLTTDNDISTEKPLFRSEEDGTRTTSGNLGDYMTLPTAADFSIRLEKADGTYAKTWTTLGDFQSETASSGFKTGAYTITAFCGKKGEQDFEKPYFEASSTFTVMSEKTSEVELTAELKNSMVKVNYTDNFKNYMSEYHSTLRTDGRSEEITFNSTEGRPAFIEPKNANLTVHFTTAVKGQTTNLSLGEFAPMAKTLHNVTLDVTGNDYGTAKLTATFDSSLTDENIEIDLSDDLFVTPPPTVTCEGFENGSTVEMLEGTASANALKMNIRAKGTIAKAELKVTEANGNFIPAWCIDTNGSATSSNTIDLCVASPAQQTQLENAGIKAIGLYPEAHPNDMAFLDLTQCGKAFNEKGTYTISLIVTDKRGTESEIQSIVINTLPVEINMVGTPNVLFGSDEALVTIDYNGFNADTDVTFSAVNANGIHETAPVKSCQEMTETRAFDKKRYQYNISLPSSTKSSIELKAFHHGKEVGTYYLNVVEPSITIGDVDAFAHYAYVKIATPDNTDNPKVLNAVTNNIRLKAGESELTITGRDSKNGILTVTGLTAGTNYTINSRCIISTPTENWSTISKQFKTEEALGVPNGDFEDLTETINTTINQGGKWTNENLKSAERFTTTLTMYIKEPTGWISSNSETCNVNNAKNKNSWYVIPSVYNTTLSWVSHQPEAKVIGIGQDAEDTTAEIYKNLTAHSGANAMVIRNVAWDANGPSITDDQKTGNTSFSNYYCSNKPSSIANRTAGFLKLGDNGNGASFASRPAKLKGFYKYQNDSQDAYEKEKGKVTVEILNGNTTLGSGEFELRAANGYTEFEVSIKYTSSMFSSKATTLKISITSSNRKSDIKTTDYCNKEECCSRGATLTVDNLTFEYSTKP